LNKFVIVQEQNIYVYELEGKNHFRL